MTIARPNSIMDAGALEQYMDDHERDILDEHLFSTDGEHTDQQWELWEWLDILYPDVLKEFEKAFRRGEYGSPI